METLAQFLNEHGHSLVDIAIFVIGVLIRSPLTPKGGKQ